MGSAARLHPLPRVWGCPGEVQGVSGREGDGEGGGPPRGTGPCWMPTATGSALAPQKVMHTRKRHSELYHELNQKFHTLDRYRAPAAGSSKVRAWGSHPASVCSTAPLHLPRHGLGRPGEDGGGNGTSPRMMLGLSAVIFFRSEKSGGASHRAVGRRARPM